MVNRLRLNEKSVRDAEPAQGRDYQIFDTDVRGLVLSQSFCVWVRLLDYVRCGPLFLRVSY
jgi:hypothetical protein